MSQEITDEQRNIVARIEKMLQVKGRTDEEAAAYVAKAQALLEQHNLTMDVIERESGGGGKRMKEEIASGFYAWQRDLWTAVGDLNFCWAYRAWRWERRRKTVREWDEKKRFVIVVIGRKVNCLATKAMAGYLLQTVQRLTRERLGERHGDDRANGQMLSRWAIDYREGIVEAVVEKIQVRRQIVLREEEAKARAAAKMAMDGASSGTGLTLGTLIKQEEDANADFVFGEGWSAKRAAERAQAAMFRRMSDEEYTIWAAANPEEAAEREAQKRAARRSSGRRYAAPKERQRDWGAYRSGHEAGQSVSIDLQADRAKTAGLL